MTPSSRARHLLLHRRDDDVPHGFLRVHLRTIVDVPGIEDDDQVEVRHDDRKLAPVAAALIDDRRTVFVPGDPPLVAVALVEAAIVGADVGNDGGGRGLDPRLGDDACAIILIKKS